MIRSCKRVSRLVDLRRRGCLLLLYASMPAMDSGTSSRKHESVKERIRAGQVFAAAFE
jgi:hypothetical protein